MLEDLVTIGQWLEEKLCFGTFGHPCTDDKTYRAVGEKFVKYLRKDNDLSQDELHSLMKALVAYRLTPIAINFVYKNQNELGFWQNRKNNQGYEKSVMFLTDKALCYFRITDFSCGYIPDKKISLCLKEYAGMYPDEKMVVELNGVESIEKDAGKDLMQKVITSLKDTPILIQVNFLHYGDRNRTDGLAKLQLEKWYKSFGFVNINDEFDGYANNIVMLRNPKNCNSKDKSDLSWNAECKLWFAFYLTFNDDNVRHADNAFYNNHLYDTTQAELHEHNVDWVRQILEHGLTEEDILKYMPGIEQYIEEAKVDNSL